VEIGFISKTQKFLRRRGRYTISLLNTNIDHSSEWEAVRRSLFLKRPRGASGRPEDERAFLKAAGLSRLGDRRCLFRCSRRRGRLIGWLLVSQQAASSIQSAGVAWVKQQALTSFIPNVLQCRCRPTGSTFIRPHETSVISFTQRVAVSRTGDLSPIISHFLTS